MTEQLVLSKDPAIVIPGGTAALYGERPFPVAIATGELYFVPEKAELEPRVQAATFLALLGESNKSVDSLLSTGHGTGKRWVNTGRAAWGVPDRFGLPYYGFSEGICMRTKGIPPYEKLLPRMVEVFDAIARDGTVDAAEEEHIKPRTVKSYRDSISKRMNVTANRARLALLGIMSGQIGDFETTTPEAILAPRHRGTL